jgi:lysophospholipase L1-like esterase
MRNRLVIFLFSTALIVIASMLLVCKLDNYKDYLRFRLDPLEAYRLASQRRPAENGFWIIGDSRAADWDSTQLGFIRIGTSNLGIGGQTSRQVLERFRNDMEKSRPFCLLIQVGINDLKSIGLLKDVSITQDCILNIMQMLETCKEHEINAIYTAIFPPGDIEIYRRPFWEPSTIDSLRRVNEEIRAYCQDNGFIFFDTYQLLENHENPGTVIKNYQSGFLHINEGGYHLISTALQHLLSTCDEDWVNHLIE